MKLYHGSTVEIKEIDIAKSKPNKDFGRGFYLSADKQQAQRLAEYKAYQIGGNPVINVYDFDERLLTDGTLKVRRFDRYFDKEITLETFLENLKYMKGITFQYFFGTEKAIKYLKKL